MAVGWCHWLETDHRTLGGRGGGVLGSGVWAAKEESGEHRR